MGILKSAQGVAYSDGTDAVLASARDAAVHRLEQVWCADPRTAAMAVNLDWDLHEMVVVLAPYVWDLAISEARQGSADTTPLTGRKAEVLARDASRRAQNVGVSRLGAIAFTVRTMFVTEEGAQRGGTGVDLRLPQPEFFAAVSKWLTREVLSAWRLRPELRGVIGTHAAMTYGDATEQSRDSAIIDACRASLHWAWLNENWYAGDYHDWEWKHWVMAMSLASADIEAAEAALTLGVHEQRTLMAKPPG